MKFMNKHVWLFLLILTIGIVNASAGRLLHEYATAMFILPVLAWLMLPNRYYAYAAMLGHYLGYGFPLAISPYFDDNALYGFSAWFGQAVVMSLPFLLWFENRYFRLIFLFIVLFMTAFTPPFAFISYGHPFISLGYLFPMTGWFAFVIMAMFFVLVTFNKVRIYALVLLFILALILNAFYNTSMMNGWTGLNTNSKTDTRSFMNMFAHVQSLKLHFNDDDRVVVIPEGNFTLITKHVANELASGDDSRIFIICADQFSQDSEKITRSLYLYENGDFKPVYAQHMPPPGSMWTPWNDSGFLMRYQGTSSFVAADKHATGLICYEMLLPWVNLKAHMESPDVVVAVLNKQPVSNTSIPSAQIAATRSFARLFNKPTVISHNSYKENTNE